MKFLPALAMLTTAVFLTAAGIPLAVHYVPHDQVSTIMARTGSTGYIVQDQGLIVLAQRRSAGEVEMHKNITHVFIIVDGEATEVTGGTLVGARQVSPGQIRAESIQGGETRHLTKGDVITIPANTPHWWKEISTKTIAYYAVNIDFNY